MNITIRFSLKLQAFASGFKENQSNVSVIKQQWKKIIIYDLTLSKAVTQSLVLLLQRERESQPF